MIMSQWEIPPQLHICHILLQFAVLNEIEGTSLGLLWGNLHLMKACAWPRLLMCPFAWHINSTALLSRSLPESVYLSCCTPTTSSLQCVLPDIFKCGKELLTVTTTGSVASTDSHQRSAISSHWLFLRVCAGKTWRPLRLGQTVKDVYSSKGQNHSKSTHPGWAVMWALVLKSG